MKNYPLTPTHIEKILKKYDLEQLKTVEEIKTGLINPIYLINSKYILRIELHTYEQNPDKLKRESILLISLPKLNIPTPNLIGFDDSKEIINTPYILLNFIPGHNLTHAFAQLDEKEQKNISYQLGEIAQRIHQVTAKDVNNETLFGNIDKWIAKSINDFEKYWKAVKDTDFLADNIKQEISDTSNKFKKLNWKDKGGLIHGDFSASNIQINNGKIVGILDFEYAFIGDPLWDLQKLPLSFQLGEKFSKEDFIKGYGLTNPTEEEKTRLKMHAFHQGVWEIWATLTNHMPFGNKEIEEGKELINNTHNDKFLH